MSFVGILCAPKQEMYIKQVLQNYMSSENSIILKEDNIENFKNITFETVAIFSELGNVFEKTKTLTKIIEKAKYVIINADAPIPFQRNKNIKRKYHYVRF